MAAKNRPLKLALGGLSYLVGPATAVMSGVMSYPLSFACEIKRTTWQMGTKKTSSTDMHKKRRESLAPLSALSANEVSHARGIIFAHCELPRLCGPALANRP